MAVYGYSKELPTSTSDNIANLNTITGAVVHKVLQLEKRISHFVDDTAGLGDLAVDSELKETERTI